VTPPATISGYAERGGVDATPAMIKRIRSSKADGTIQLTDADSKLLVFAGELGERQVSILIDSGASAQFVSEALAKELSLELTEKKIGNRVSLADGTRVASNHYVKIRYSIGPFSEEETFHLLPLANYDLVLGRSWLDRHNPASADVELAI